LIFSEGATFPFALFKLCSNMKFNSVGIFILIIFLGCTKSTKVKQESSLCPDSSFSDIKLFLGYNNARESPLIMAHRGGPSKGFPENCIPTFERTLEKVNCPLIEFDVRMTKDSMLVLLHDDELELCTNGGGLLSETNWSKLQQLKLIDDESNLTPIGVPTFEEVLVWFEKKPAILIIDAKPKTNLDLVLNAINKSKVKNKSVLICYSIEDAEYVFSKTPYLMLALGFNNESQVKAIEESKIPKDQILALTPRELQPISYYERIHKLGISCSLGTNGNIDTIPISFSKTMYQERFQKGVDIICTDNPIEVSNLFKEFSGKE
jgi:glycerophosphoryl diester phosphodiesterase